ncbi:MAG: homoserine dehydrogenase [Elusimicrobia bacterium]|nr:homoserine dehydrogenase [Elusimicrobiota bacterium]
MINIGIIGLGTVGGGVYEIINKRLSEIELRVGSPLRIKKVCDLREEFAEELNIPKGIFTTDYNEVVDDSDISLVVMLTGNADLDFTILKKCFEQGKHIVTANKALMAKKWSEIFELCRRYKTLIYFEASVGSGIPVIQGINEGLAANRIDQIKGILNGTTNYILSKMEEEGTSLEDATADAVKAGFAEVDSSADLKGWDAAHKLCILTNMVFPHPVKLEDIYCEGIENIELSDMDFALEMFGFSLKLLAVFKRKGDEAEVRVHPAFVPEEDMLAGVFDENNGILVSGDSVKDVMFYGKGAGRFPAASAVVSDIIYLAQKISYSIAGKIPYIHTDTSSNTRVIDMEELSFQYYLRFMTEDKPGVLSKITGILGAENISILSCFQKGRAEGGNIPIITLTHMASVRAVRRALKKIDALDTTG